MTTWHSYLEISQRLNIPLRTLYLYNQEGVGPKTLKVGRHFRVSDSDLQEWLIANTK